MLRVRKHAIPITAGVCLALALAGPLARAADAATAEAAEAAEEKSQAGVDRLNLWYSGTPLERVLERIGQAAVNINIRIVAEDEEDQEALERMPVTLELNQVSWRTALKVLAKKYNFVLDWSMEGEGIVWLRQMQPVTVDYTQIPFGDFIRMIQKESGASIAVNPELLASDAPAGFSGEGLPWKVVLETVVDMHGLVMKEDDYGVIRIHRPEDVQEKMTPKVFPLRYISAEGPPYRGEIQRDSVVRLREDDTTGDFALVEVLRQIASEAGRISYVRETNQIVALDTPSKLDEIQKIIRDMDRPPMQVQIDTRLVTMRMNEDDDDHGRKVGMLWNNGFIANVTSGIRYDTSFPLKPEWVGGETMSHLGPLSAIATPGGTGNRQLINAADLQDADLTGAETVDYRTGNGVLSFEQLQATLQMIEQSTNVEIMQAPSIVAMDNEESTVQVGRVIRWAVQNIDAESGQITYAEAANSPIIAGVQLMVVPRVVPEEDRVILTVIPTEEEFDGFENFPSDANPLFKLPRTRSKTVVTRMMLNNRETGVIAGLLSTKTRHEEKKIPFLGSVPVLGRLFRHDWKKDVKEEVMIFITPTIINSTHGEDFESELAGVRRAAVAGFEE